MTALTPLPSSAPIRRHPFVLIARDGADTVEVLTGDVVDVELLADIPLTIDGAPREVFALVPYRQVRERGFVAHDDGAPLRCIIVDEHLHLPTATSCSPRCRRRPVPLARRAASTSPTRSTPAIVATVIADEIGRGEGANFVIRRDFTARHRRRRPHGRADLVPRAARPRARRVLDLRDRHARPHRRRREPRGARRRARRRRHDEPDLGHVPPPRGRRHDARRSPSSSPPRRRPKSSSWSSTRS